MYSPYCITTCIWHDWVVRDKLSSAKTFCDSAKANADLLNSTALFRISMIKLSIKREEVNKLQNEEPLFARHSLFSCMYMEWSWTHFIQKPQNDKCNCLVQDGVNTLFIRC